MEHLGEKAQVEAHFSLFGDGLVSVQDRGTVYAECTTGSKIILDAHDEATW
jgi:hypothetical protein